MRVGQHDLDVQLLGAAEIDRAVGDVLPVGADRLHDPPARETVHAQHLRADETIELERAGGADLPTRRERSRSRSQRLHRHLDVGRLDLTVAVGDDRASDRTALAGRDRHPRKIFVADGDWHRRHFRRCVSGCASGDREHVVTRNDVEHRERAIREDARGIAHLQAALVAESRRRQVQDRLRGRAVGIDDRARHAHGSDRLQDEVDA